MGMMEILSGIWQGLDVTLGVTLLGLLYAVPFAFVFGILQYFTRGATHAVVTAVIEFWRSSPVIILLFVFYYTLPTLNVNLSALTVGAMVLGLNTGGYGSQAVRAALQSLGAGQAEAGAALGMTRFDVLCRIELPQAYVAMLPSLINLLIQLIKGTALVSLITLGDMTFRAKEIAQITYDPVRIYTALLLTYLVLCYPITILGRFLERRAAHGKEMNHGI